MVRRFNHLPLFWKILLPFTTLMLVIGAFGAFLIVRTLTARSQSALEQDLSRRALETRSLLRDRELSLLESATLASNLEGMAPAVARRDARPIARLGGSVLALKTEFRLLTFTDRSGRGLVEFERTRVDVRRVPGRMWSGQHVADRALAETTTTKHSGYLPNGDETLLAVAAPICAGTPCSPVGVAIVGEPLADVAAAAHRSAPGPRSSVALYDERGVLLASAGPIASDQRAPALDGETPILRMRRGEGQDVVTMYAPLSVQGRSIGRIGVSIPSAPAFAPAREAAFRLGLLLLAAMVGVVAIGVAISRLILAQVRPLVEANRALGSGDLSARVPVLSDDELGELARGVNKMAGELQESYETLEARVAERTDQVLQLLQDRTDFFAAISHELRTPIAVIIANAEMMGDRTVPKGARWTAETGTVIGQSATQLLSLVNDILDLARAEAGRLVVEVEDVDIAQVIGGVRPAVESLARTGEIDVRFRVPRRLPVKGDGARLRQILLNLVDNAVKYTPPRGEIHIEARRRDDGMAQISVSDNGIGIPPEIGDRIFEPFFRVPETEPQHGQPSTGLGLALARRLVDAHGGEISYTSDADGTCFVFTVPATRRSTARTGTTRPGRATMQS